MQLHLVSLSRLCLPLTLLCVVQVAVSLGHRLTRPPTLLHVLAQRPLPLPSNVRLSRVRKPLGIRIRRPRQLRWVKPQCRSPLPMNVWQKRFVTPAPPRNNIPLRLLPVQSYRLSRTPYVVPPRCRLTSLGRQVSMSAVVVRELCSVPPRVPELCNVILLIPELVAKPPRRVNRGAVSK